MLRNSRSSTICKLQTSYLTNSRILIVLLMLRQLLLTFPLLPHNQVNNRYRSLRSLEPVHQKAAKGLLLRWRLLKVLWKSLLISPRIVINSVVHQWVRLRQMPSVQRLMLVTMEQSLRMSNILRWSCQTPWWKLSESSKDCLHRQNIMNSMYFIRTIHKLIWETSTRKHWWKKRKKTRRSHYSRSRIKNKRRKKRRRTRKEKTTKRKRMRIPYRLNPYSSLNATLLREDKSVAWISMLLIQI